MHEHPDGFWGVAPGAQPVGAHRLELFGKKFAFDIPTSHKDRVIKHPSYPMLRGDHAVALATEYAGSGKIVMSGCVSRLHPYRLLRVGESGRLEHLLEIPQEIRGYRQQYPRALRFVPAMIFLARDRSVWELLDDTSLALHEYPHDLLLDQSHPLERLLIHARLGDGPERRHAKPLAPVPGSKRRRPFRPTARLRPRGVS